MFDHKVLLTEIIICSSINNMLKKCTSGKAFYITATAQFFVTLIIRMPACLLTAMTKFQDKFANLRQVNSPNSQNKFQICCTDMYLVRFLANFVVFCDSLNNFHRFT